jgi:hypothetical protein
LALALAVPAFAAKTGPGTSTGTAQIFFPNPVAYLQDQTLTDQKDANYPALWPAYVTKELTNLDGSGFLRGDWANVTSSTGDLAFSETNTFVYTRDDDRFEQVMAYYWITEAQKYIQSLGFGTTRRPINMESQDVHINQWGQDNSFSTTHKDYLLFGKGGVDDAEDAEVILHEYGHSMQATQFTGVAYAGETGGIMEGFGDYWAVTVSNIIAPTPDPACVMDWDATYYTSTVPHCLRRVDRNLHYPEDLTTSVHRNGMIWSRALWDIRQALGSTMADTLILEAQFGFNNITSMPAAAQITVETAESLYGHKAAKDVEAAFQARGILP